MTKTSKTVVFFGSGPVAAASLELLLQDFIVEAVVTKPKPAHHKDAFPVIEVAKKHKLPLHTVTNKKELSKLIATKPFTSPVAVLIDFGIIVGQDAIDYFPRGIVNSHFSVLPDLRGADPITFAILSGQEKTGVSLMLLVEAMDEGPLISFGEYSLPTDIDTPTLTKQLISLSHMLLQAELPRYLGNPDFKPADQSITGRSVSYSRKLTKDDGLIDWTKPADQIEREIRAYLDWPRSRTTIAGKAVAITKAHVVPVNHPPDKPGTIEAVAGIIMVECGRDSLCIERLQPAGKTEMTAEAFINGHKDLLTK